MSKVVIDQMNRELEVPQFPKRIISLVPSQTELLYDLGLATEVVGITKFCIHPSSWRKEKTIIGGTKQFRFDTIDQLQPDLIIGNKEENYQEGIDLLAQKYPVWMSDITTLDEAYQMMIAVGGLVGRANEAQQLVEQVKGSFQNLGDFPKKRALYFIWREPYMLAGKGTFINNMMKLANIENVISAARYPMLSAEELKKHDPDYVLLSSEPYPFKEKHKEELQELFPKASICLVDGELFSWYGSRLLHSASYLENLFS